MRIQELERLVDIERATIRFYEKEGLVSPRRSENGYRDYTPENADELKKIRLLRQLGMSIDKIRMLQQGSADFSQALNDQLRILSRQIAEQKRARAVCQALYDDGQEYRTMDADHYLKLMREIKIDDREMKNGDFHEKLPEEIHPWRRWIARGLDYALVLSVVRFVLIVIFRVRPLPGNFLSALIAVFVGLIFVPVEAFLLSRWGTTPGKLVMGLRLESIQGGNLPFREALTRAWCVFWKGMGFCIPYVKLAVQLVRYCQLTGRTIRRFARYDELDGPQEMPWDEETEIIYEGKSRKRGLAFATVMVLLIALGTLAGLDAIKPKYRGSELTVAQFADNYNSYIQMMDDGVQVYEMLKSDGTKEPIPAAVAVYGISEGSEYEPRNFEYEAENGILKAVGISDSWDDVFYLHPLGGETVDVAVSLLLAQDGCGIMQLREFLEIWSRYEGLDQAEFTYRNLEIAWMIQSENCICRNGTYYAADDEKPSKLDFSFRVRILE